MARILLVDDSEITRAMIAEFLQMGGHQIAGEADGLAKAVAAYKAQKPDLVTLDLSMGEDDGFTVLHALLEIDPKARVLMVSANTQADIYDQLIAEGALGFIVKPFSLAEITAAVSKALAVKT